MAFARQRLSKFDLHEASAPRCFVGGSAACRLTATPARNLSPSQASKPAHTNRAFPVCDEQKLRRRRRRPAILTDHISRTAQHRRDAFQQTHLRMFPWIIACCTRELLTIFHRGDASRKYAHESDANATHGSYCERLSSGAQAERNGRSGGDVEERAIQELELEGWQTRWRANATWPGTTPSPTRSA